MADPIRTAENMRTLLVKANKSVPMPMPVRDPQGLGLGHIMWMLGEIEAGERPVPSDDDPLGQRDPVVGEKAHRWIGYVQGWCVANGHATLEECRCAVLFS